MNIAKLYRQIRFVIVQVLRNMFGFFVGLFIWRDKNILVMGNSPRLVFEQTKKQEQFCY